MNTPHNTQTGATYNGNRFDQRDLRDPGHSHTYSDVQSDINIGSRYVPSSRPQQPLRAKPSAPPLKGHEAFLKGLEQGEANVMFIKVNGDTVTGKIKASDKYTVSVIEAAEGAYQTRVLFKHDISEFRPMGNA